MEALHLGLVYCVIGLVLGGVGGLLSALVAAGLRRGRSRGGPASPAGVA